MPDMEQIKRESRGLRGTIAEGLKSDQPKFDETDQQLIKFHGFYQEDDRDRRVERRQQKLDRYYIFMVRSKIPGGFLTPEQYLVHDGLAERYGNSTLRITSRQGLQLHFILKGDLKECIAAINRSGITTWGACGDVVRNVMASPLPLDTPAYRDIRQLAVELKDAFAAQSRAYSEIWLDGEKLNLGQEPEEEPIYGNTYLPRKFKIGLAVPPRNDIDIYSNDLGLVSNEENGAVSGYTFLVGGGMGMSHGRKDTYPVLARPLMYVPRPYVIDACKAVVLTQRDFGNREDRKKARLKYLIEERGILWFLREVQSRLDSGVHIEVPRPLTWDTVSDLLGWNAQGDGRLFLGVWVPDGRIHDSESVLYRKAFREIAERFALPIRLTANCNILFCDIDPAQKDAIDALLRQYNIPPVSDMTETRKVGMACVALPTCGLALAESERVFQGLMDSIDATLRDLDLQDEPILIRMTGCPNGCARPYNADIAFVGKSANQYTVYVGGSHRGDRLAGLEEKMVKLEDIPALVRGYLQDFAQNRLPGESFGDFWTRTRGTGSHPHPSQFHDLPGEWRNMKAAPPA